MVRIDYYDEEGEVNIMMATVHYVPQIGGIVHLKQIGTDGERTKLGKYTVTEVHQVVQDYRQTYVDSTKEHVEIFLKKND